MFHQTRIAAAAFTLLGAALFDFMLVRAPVTHAASNTYYVDCSATSNGDGSSGSPWNALAAITNTIFSSGDSILLKRSTSCSGAVWPKGSGTSRAPITLSAYGTGARPIISAGSSQYAIKLFNQEYWKIESLETTGGTNWSFADLRAIGWGRHELH